MQKDLKKFDEYENKSDQNSKEHNTIMKSLNDLKANIELLK